MKLVSIVVSLVVPRTESNRGPIDYKSIAKVK